MATAGRCRLPYNDPGVCARDAHPAGLVARCLAKDPSDRFPTARDLDRALAGCGCAAERDGGQ